MGAKTFVLAVSALTAAVFAPEMTPKNDEVTETDPVTAAP
jgi:hypothetical protein